MQDHMFLWDLLKTIIARKGSSDSSAIFTRHCTFGCPLILDYKILLIDKNFNSLGDCKRHVGQLFAQKDEKFQKDETMKLPEK